MAGEHVWVDAGGCWWWWWWMVVVVVVVWVVEGKEKGEGGSYEV
jgi:hypothetical protein